MTKGTCSVEDCDRFIKAHGWCGTHYARWRKNGTVELAPKAVKPRCPIDGCHRQVTVRGMCGAHYQEERRATTQPCSIRGCDAFQRAGGLCAEHHSRLRRTGTTDDPKPSAKLCGIDGCPSPARARGWCNMHYRRWVLHGDPLTTLTEKRAAARDATTKICIHCQRELPLTEFSPRREMLDGRRSSCKECVRSYMRERARRKRERLPLPVKPPPAQCSVADCQRNAITRGWCKGHYERWRRNGSVIPKKIVRPHRTADQMAADEKACSKCKRFLPIDAFSDRADAPDGKSYVCRRCNSTHNAAIRKRYAEDVEFRDKRIEYYKKYRQKYPEDVRERQRASKLWLHYGMTLDEYEALYRAQGGVCKICHGGPHGGPDWARKQWLSVDHCHETGRIRGLLCDDCNIGLGKFAEDPKRLATALEYLKASLMTT